MHAVRSTLRTLKLLGYFVRFSTELIVRPPKSTAAGADWLHRLCATAMRGLGVSLAIDGAFPARGALITNHMGYLDIIALSAMRPCVFVSKAEIEHWPLLGWFARTAGTVFVARGRGGSAAKAEAGLKAASAAGLPVIFFPEGTTTNGEGMLPFRSGVLAQVLAAGQPVTAGFVRYSLDPACAAANGAGVTVEDSVSYWGDGSLLGHIFRFLGLRGVGVRVKIAVKPVEFSAAAEADRKRAAVEAQAAVLALAGGAVGVVSEKAP